MISSEMTRLAQRCASVRDIADGLMEGVSRFSGPSRVAAITTFESPDKLFISDDHGLLTDYAKDIAAYYLRDQTWKTRIPMYGPDAYQMGFYPQQPFELPKVIAYATSSPRILYQSWFVERPPNLVSEGPLTKWLEYVSLLLHYESFTWVLGAERPHRVAAAASANYADQAVAEYIRCELNLATTSNTKLNVSAVIDAVLGISSTYEEGQRAAGRLVIAEESVLQQQAFVVKFPNDSFPSLNKWKHAQKLLRTVSGTNLSLVSNGQWLMGICEISPSEKGIINVNFQGGSGEFLVGAKPVCSFRDGRIYSSSLRPNLNEFSTTRTKIGLTAEQETNLTSIVKTLAESAIKSRHGCTVVIDLNKPLLKLAGQQLECPLDISKKAAQALAVSMSQVDGAVQLTADGSLRAFGCILDGPLLSSEDRSRGARYNSALRFSKQNPKCVVVVVSEDGNISLFHEGKNIQEPPEPLHRATQRSPTLPLLEEWIRRWVY